MNKIFLTALFFTTLVWGNLQAQEPTKKEIRKAKKAEKKAASRRYMMLGLGSGWYTFQDLQMSEGIYSGPGVLAEWRRWELYPKAKHDIIWFRFVGGLTTAFHEGAETQVAQPEFRYTYTRNIAKWGPEEKHIIRFGGYISAMANFRNNPSLGNSANHWDIMPSIGPAVDIDIPFVLPLFKTQSLFNYQLGTSIFAYNNSLPSYSLSGGESSNHYWVFGRQGRLMSEASLIIPIRKSNSNLFKLTYNWELLGYKDSDIHKARFGQHNLSFTLMVNLHASNL